MSILKPLLISILSVLIPLSVTSADENFGKQIPSQEKIIDLFKSNDSALPASKTRGINIIGSDKSQAKTKVKTKPISPVMEEKAISLEVLFDYDSANLTEQAMRQLEPVGLALASDDLKGMAFRVEGHTDGIGGDQYNLELSRRRAESVKSYLIERYGLTDVSIHIVGKGETELADMANPASEANRRVRIVRLAHAN